MLHKIVSAFLLLHQVQAYSTSCYQYGLSYSYGQTGYFGFKNPISLKCPVPTIGLNVTITFDKNIIKFNAWNGTNEQCCENVCTFFTDENWNSCHFTNHEELYLRYDVNYASYPPPRIIELHFDNLLIHSSRVAASK